MEHLTRYSDWWESWTLRHQRYGITTWKLYQRMLKENQSNLVLKWIKMIKETLIRNPYIHMLNHLRVCDVNTNEDYETFIDLLSNFKN